MRGDTEASSGSGAARLYDVAVVGGGPAGLAAAIGAAQRGLSVVLLERQALPADKACGEGLMPSGLAALERLGVRALLDPASCSPFVGVRYVQEDGSCAEARFRGGQGLGIRRTALAEALLTRARALKVDLRAGSPVRHHERREDRVVLHLDASQVEARFLIAADGLASPLRRAEGLEAPLRGPRRYGLRQHFRCAPWSPFVEIYFSEGVEAYVTPAGPERVGVAFLWELGRVEMPVSFERLLARVPVLSQRLRGVEVDSEPRGAGPLARNALASIAPRFALLGDAAGYVDAITGEGLSLAFESAEVLCSMLPEALARGGGRAALQPYAQAHRRLFRRYAGLTHAVLALARRPWLRRIAVRFLGRHPGLFSLVVDWVTGRPLEVGEGAAARLLMPPSPSE